MEHRYNDGRRSCYECRCLIICTFVRESNERGRRETAGKRAIPVLLVHAHCWLYVYVDSAVGRRLLYPSRGKAHDNGDTIAIVVVVDQSSCR